MHVCMVPGVRISFAYQIKLARSNASLYVAAVSLYVGAASSKLSAVNECGSLRMIG